MYNKSLSRYPKLWKLYVKNEFTKNITNTAAIEFLRLVSFKILNIMDASIDTITNWNKVTCGWNIIPLKKINPINIPHAEGSM